MMAGSSWAELEGLYQRARGNDSEAWEVLLEEVPIRVLRWLRAAFSRSLHLWELEDISRFAFEETSLRAAAIPSWPQAWVFTCQVARSMTFDQMRKRHGVITFALLGGNFVEPIDPASSKHLNCLELLDEIDSVASRLGESNQILFLSLMESFLEGRRTIPLLARKLRISESTVKRRLSSLRLMWTEEYNSVCP